MSLGYFDSLEVVALISFHKNSLRWICFLDAFPNTSIGIEPTCTVLEQLF